MRLSSRLLRCVLGSDILEGGNNCLTSQIVRYKHKPAKNEECMEPCATPRRSIWNIFRRNKKEQKPLQKEEPKKTENAEFVTEEQAEYDMQKISKMGGKAYRTCGSAYILQKDYIEQPEATTNLEDEILEDMMKDPSLKGQCDPMPPFQSAGLKLIELSERRLHPLYKKLMSIPKRPKSQPIATTKAPFYKTRSGPVMADEFPPHLKINKEMFERKNIFYEFKRAEPPQQMVARIVELKNNERPPLVKNAQNKGTQGKDCAKA